MSTEVNECCWVAVVEVVESLSMESSLVLLLTVGRSASGTGLGFTL